MHYLTFLLKKISYLQINCSSRHIFSKSGKIPDFYIFVENNHFGVDSGYKSFFNFFLQITVEF